MHRVIWLTGESGAGKTALANELVSFRRNGIEGIILDGDEMRASVSLNAGFEPKDRKEHNLRVARLANELSKQSPVIVAVIAPMADVRKMIDGICHPVWVYVKRTLPKREGHFYEEPEGYFTTDHDKVNVDQSTCNVLAYLRKPVYSLFIGRYQPLHDGHKALFRKVLDEGKNVLVALRDTPKSDSNPYDVEDRHAMFEKEFAKEIWCGRLKVISIPDIEEVVWGRGVGWGRREIRLDEATESISATDIRKGGEQK